MSGQTRKEPITIFESAARVVGTPTETTDWLPIPKDCMGLHLVLDVTAAAKDNADTLDVEVFTKFGTETARGILYFTQVVGDGGAKVFIAKILVNKDVALYGYAALTAGNQKDILGDAIQGKYTIVDADSDGGFTFSLYALPL